MMPRFTRADAFRALGHAKLLATSAGFGWLGLHVGSGQEAGWSGDDLVVRGDYPAVNRDADAGRPSDAASAITYTFYVYFPLASHATSRQASCGGSPVW